MNKEKNLWKMADGTTVPLASATDEQLEQFLAHCRLMLDSHDRRNPGRRTLIKIIDEQLHRCNVELMMRKLETGAISADASPYPRYLYLRDICAYMDSQSDIFPPGQRNSLPITMIPGNLPKEFSRLTIGDVTAAASGQLGIMANRHITRTFLCNIGLFLNEQELREYARVGRNRMEVVKEVLELPLDTHIRVTPTGLSLKEFRAMLQLKAKKYQELTTIQLQTLRDKVLFLLKEKVQKHIAEWEKLERQILMEMETRRVTSDNVMPSMPGSEQDVAAPVSGLQEQARQELL